MKRLIAFAFILFAGLAQIPAHKVSAAWWWCAQGTPCPTGTATPTPTPTPSFISANTPTTCGGANCVVTLPTGLSDGDIITGPYMSNTSNLAMPSGWLTLQIQAGAGGTEYWLQHRYTTGDAATITFTNSSLGDITCLAAYRGLVNIDKYNTYQTATSTTPTNTGVTTVGTNDLIVFGAVWGGTSAFTSAATGFTSRANKAASSGTTFGCSVEDKLLASPGPVGSVNDTLAASVTNGAMMTSYLP